jgi:type I restriction enzyme R subunit
LSVKDDSRKIREIIEEYLISKGLIQKFHITALSDEFSSAVKKKTPKLE